MSHGSVFQLEKIKKCDYEKEDVGVLEEYSMEKHNFPDPNWVDYWSNSDELPEKDFEYLCKSLPEGCFDIDKNELSITLVKRPESYVSNYFDKIREESEKLNLSDFVENKCSTWNLEKLLRNNSKWNMVYFEEDGYPIYMHEWLCGLAKHGEIGETWYMGGVLDYHF